MSERRTEPWEMALGTVEHPCVAGREVGSSAADLVVLPSSGKRSLPWRLVGLPRGALERAFQDWEK